MTETSPGVLYQQAVTDAGPDPEAIGARYRELLAEHGHLLKPGDPGYEQGARNLPCGWPGQSLTRRYVPRPGETRAQVERRVRGILRSAVPDLAGRPDGEPELEDMVAYALEQWVEWPVADLVSRSDSPDATPRKPLAVECEGCGSSVVWAQTVSGDLAVPIAAGSAGSPSGTIAAWMANEVLRCRVLRPGDDLMPGEFRGLDHRRVCAPATNAPAGWSQNRRHHRWEYRAGAGQPPLYWLHVQAAEEWSWPEIEEKLAARSAELGVTIAPLPAEAKATRSEI